VLAQRAQCRYASGVLSKWPTNKDIADRWTDWQGKEVLLLKTTLHHVTALHLEESFMLVGLKAIFSNPLYVVWNPGAETENAIFDLPLGKNRYFLVSVKKIGLLKKYRALSTLYSVQDDRLPDLKWKLLWGTRQ
jgi:hypothetical protein